MYCSAPCVLYVCGLGHGVYIDMFISPEVWAMVGTVAAVFRLSMLTIRAVLVLPHVAAGDLSGLHHRWSASWTGNGWWWLLLFMLVVCLLLLFLFVLLRVSVEPCLCRLMWVLGNCQDCVTGGVRLGLEMVVIVVVVVVVVCVVVVCVVGSECRKATEAVRGVAGEAERGSCLAGVGLPLAE
jgi:hypothetical protein